MTDTDIRRQRDRFVAFSFAAADLLVEVDRHQRIRFATGATRRLFGAEPRDLIGRQLLEFFPESERMIVAGALAGIAPGERFAPLAVCVGPESAVTAEAVLAGCRLPGADTGAYLVLSAARLPNAPGMRKARRDAETGLLQREDFTTLAEESIRLARDAGQNLRLTLLHTPGLDRAADTGAATGIELRRRLGGFLRSQAVRDTSGRIGPDRFGVVHDAELPSERLGAGIARIVDGVGATAADVRVEAHSVVVDDAIDRDDIGRALVYTVNRFAESGPDGFDIDAMTTALDGMMDEAMQRIVGFKRVVAGQRIGFALQPIVSLDTGRPHHHELLARFEEGKSPFETIRFAEDVGIIHEMDMAMCRTAIEHLHDRHENARLPIAVNLSARSIGNERFVGGLVEMLQPNPRFRLELQFEITESTGLGDLALANAAIQRIRRLGHQVGLDDFGAGSTSFQYLHALEVDDVKVDGRYVRSIVESDRDRHLVKAMVGLCRDLGMHTTAEMVETRPQAEAVRALGVEFGQGYLFGRPIAAPPPSPATSPAAEPGLARGRVTRGGHRSWV